MRPCRQPLLLAFASCPCLPLLDLAMLEANVGLDRSEVLGRGLLRFGELGGGAPHRPRAFAAFFGRARLTQLVYLALELGDRVDELRVALDRLCEQHAHLLRLEGLPALLALEPHALILEQEDLAPKRALFGRQQLEQPVPLRHRALSFELQSVAPRHILAQVPVERRAQAHG